MFLLATFLSLSLFFSFFLVASFYVYQQLRNEIRNKRVAANFWQFHSSNRKLLRLWNRSRSLYLLHGATQPIEKSTWSNTTSFFINSTYQWWGSSKIHSTNQQIIWHWTLQWTESSQFSIVRSGRIKVAWNRWQFLNNFWWCDVKVSLTCKWKSDLIDFIRIFHSSSWNSFRINGNFGV